MNLLDLDNLALGHIIQYTAEECTTLVLLHTCKRIRGLCEEPLTKYTNLFYPNLVYKPAAQGGHLALVKWLWALKFPLSHWVFDWAAESGNLQLVKWIHAQGDFITINACNYAARNGHLSVVQWLWVRDYKNSSAFRDAAAHGHLPVLQWIIDMGLPGTIHWDAFNYAAAEGHVHVLQLLRDNGIIGNTDACAFAAHNGHLDALRWLKATGITLSEVVWLMAASQGQLHILRWLKTREDVPPCSEKAMTCAIQGGHLNVAQWLHANVNKK